MDTAANSPWLTGLALTYTHTFWVLHHYCHKQSASHTTCSLVADLWLWSVQELRSIQTRARPFQSP